MGMLDGLINSALGSMMGQGGQARAIFSVRNQPRYSRHCCCDQFRVGLEDVPGNPVGRDGWPGIHRGLVILRSTSIRKRVLGTPRCVGILHCSIERKFVLQIAENPSVVYRQYRIPSYSPPQSFDSKLQLAEVPEFRSDLQIRETGYDTLQLKSAELSPV